MAFSGSYSDTSAASNQANVTFAGQTVGSGGKKTSEVPSFLKSALEGGQLTGSSVGSGLMKWAIPAALVLGVVVILAVKGR